MSEEWSRIAVLRMWSLEVFYLSTASVRSKWKFLNTTEMLFAFLSPLLFSLKCTRKFPEVVCVLVAQLCPTLLQPHGLQPARLLCPWDSPGKNTGVGCHSLLPSRGYMTWFQETECRGRDKNSAVSSAGLKPGPSGPSLLPPQVRPDQPGLWHVSCWSLHVSLPG